MNMTRFNITLDQGVKYVLRCLEIMFKLGNFFCIFQMHRYLIKSET